MVATTGCATMARTCAFLLDYRPALRRAHRGWRVCPRNGRRAHPAPRAVGHADAVLELMERPAGAGRVPGARVVDARVPVRVLNLAWHRLGWPPVERFAGPVDVAHSVHPLLMPAPRRAGRWSPSTISISSITPSGRARRSAATTPRSRRAHARARRRGRDHLRLHRRRDRAAPRRAARSHRHLLAGRAGLDRARRAPRRAGPILFMGTLEPRKNIGTLLDAYAAAPRQAARRPAALAGGRGRRRRPRRGCARLRSRR